MEDHEYQDIQKELRIVIIDDSEFSRKNISAILEKEGFNVVGQADGPEEAFKIIGQLDANLFIVDIVMPKMNGITLMKEIKEKYKKPQFIIVSTLNQEHIIVEAISAGASDYIQKPFRDVDILGPVIKIGKMLVDNKSN